MKKFDKDIQFDYILYILFVVKASILFHFNWMFYLKCIKSIKLPKGCFTVCFVHSSCFIHLISIGNNLMHILWYYIFISMR